MKIFLNFIVLIILISGCKTNTEVDKIDSKSLENIYGNWQFEKIEVNNKMVNVEDLNPCKFKDELKIEFSSEKLIFNIDTIKIEGYQIGISGKKECVNDPITFKHIIKNVSSESFWILTSKSTDKLIKVNDGLIVEYKALFKRDKLKLIKVREILNYGVSVPSKIELTRI